MEHSFNDQMLCSRQTPWRVARLHPAVQAEAVDGIVRSGPRGANWWRRYIHHMNIEYLQAAFELALFLIGLASMPLRYFR